MFKTKTLIAITSLVFLALIILATFGFIPLPFFISKEEVGKKIKSLYELANPGASIEVVTVTEQSGIYKIVLKARDLTGTTYHEVYVTKDGKLLTEGVILVEESIAQMERLRKFVDCLDGKGVRIYGMSNHTASLLQLNILGRYSLKLFVACDINIQSCLAANVTEVPSVVVDKSVYPGVKTIDWFENIAGCKF